MASTDQPLLVAIDAGSGSGRCVVFDATGKPVAAARRAWQPEVPAGLEPFGARRERWEAFDPRMDVVETDKEIKVSVELPGLEENEIYVGLSRNVLTISGEKRQEKEEKGHNYLRAERSYGSFRRSIPLPSEVDASKADAEFRNGVLTVTLPRAVKAQARKRIVVKTQ